MSEFIDKLKHASVSEPAPLGFRTVQKAIKPRLLIIALLENPDLLETVDITDVADACLFDTKKAAEYKSVEKIAKSIKNIPCGCCISGNFNIDFEKTTIDFVVFSDEMPVASLLKSEKTGRIVTVEDTMSPDIIRILDNMPQDAVFLDDRAGDKLSLTWQKLTVYKRFSTVASKPLLISVPASLNADELQAIWDMGVNGLIVRIADVESFEELKKLRKTVETLVPPSRRKRGKSRAIVPQVRTEAPAVADDDDEDDDE
jgi:hypothetical protein